MAQICPRCGGKEVDCPVCGLPPKHVHMPKMGKVRSAVFKVASIMTAVPEYEVHAIDLSAWNGVWDFSITRTKAQHVIMRLGYGNQWKDYRCDDYYAGAKAQDLAISDYWFNNVGQDAILHAENFAEQIASHPPTAAIIGDFERTYTDPLNTLRWIEKQDNKLNVLTGKWQEFYTSKGFWNTNVARSTYFAGRILHVASWTTGYPPAMPLDFVTWSRWQWSADNNGKARIYGMIRDGDPDVDLNREKLTAAQFNNRYGTHVQPLVPYLPIRPIKYVYIDTDALNLRSIPGGTGSETDIGTVQKNDDVPVIEEKNGWYRVEGWIHAGYTRPK